MSLVLDKDDPLKTRVVQRDGTPVEIVAILRKAAGEDLLLVKYKDAEGDEYSYTTHMDGYVSTGLDHDLNIINAPEPIHGWVNVYRDTYGSFYTGNEIYKTWDEAVAASVKGVIATLEIKGNVGDGL